MITYTYKCYDCEHTFDVQQSIKANRKKKCPKCKNLSLERLIYPTQGFVRGDITTIGQLADANAKK